MESGACPCWCATRNASLLSDHLNYVLYTLLIPQSYRTHKGKPKRGWASHPLLAGRKVVDAASMRRPSLARHAAHLPQRLG
eukprot:scaffold85723_cov72-Phaeocystis_antarctica.AAC.3